MSIDGYPIRGYPTGMVYVAIRITGNGAAAPTVAMALKGEPLASTDPTGITAARSGAGAYTFAFGTEKPGKFVWWMPPGYGNATAGVGTGVPKTAAIDADSLDGTSTTLAFQVHATDTGVAADLATGETLCFLLGFKQTGKGV